MEINELESYFPQIEGNILTAGIITWVLQNNIDPYSKEFKDAFDTMIDTRDQVLTLLHKHYDEQEL